MRWDNAREQLKEGVRRMAAAATISAGRRARTAKTWVSARIAIYTGSRRGCTPRFSRPLLLVAHLTAASLVGRHALCIESSCMSTTFENAGAWTSRETRPRQPCVCHMKDSRHVLQCDVSYHDRLLSTIKFSHLDLGPPCQPML